ncbi:MAG TPA: polysaccharide biosynthesis tyrosine autokinase [Gemmatimonadaceae bacterium]|nr:polysaccharide biosynthesis tyrosine autokinase [Gemmatimonadaceae bacterium]
MSQLIPMNPRRAAVVHPAPQEQWQHLDGPAVTLVPLDPRQFIGILRRHLLIALAIAGTVTALAVYIVHSTPPIYQANAAVRLTNARQELTSGLEDPTNRSSMPSVDPVLSQVEVLASRGVARAVVESLPILRVQTQDIPMTALRAVDIVPEPGVDTLRPRLLQLTFSRNGMLVRDSLRHVQRGTYGAPVALDGVRFTVDTQPAMESGTITVLPLEDAVTNLLGALQVKPRPNTDIIDVAYTGTNPWLAQRVANAVLQVYQASSLAAAQRQSRLRREFVGRQLLENDSLLVRARLALSAFRTHEQAYSAKEKFSSEQTGLANVETQRAQLEADRALYASVLSGLQQPPTENGDADLQARLSAPGVTPNPVVMALFQQMAAYEVKRDSLTAGQWGRSATDPDVARLASLLTSTRAKLVGTVGGVVHSLDSRIGSLAEFETRNTAVLGRLADQEAEEARLVEQEASYSQLGDQLREEYQKARLAEAAEVGPVEVLDLAALPRKPIGAGGMRKIVFGALLGLLLGGGGAFVVEYLNTSIRRREEMEAALQLPGLAVIPRFALRRGRLRRRNGKRKTRKPGVPSAPAVGDALITVSDLRSEAAEAYRQLRTKLLFSQLDRPMKTMAITSALPQDGKTTIAANLATTFAQQKMRVLLIDCDLRRPAQHTLFGVPREPGLTELLHEEPGTWVIQQTAVEGLSLISAGRPASEPSELLGSPRMRTVLATLSEMFDVVILDSPPVLAVTDAAILAAMVDGVLLAVRAGKTNRATAQLAMQQLIDVGARVIGGVLNDPDRKTTAHESYSYYRSYESAAQ